MNGISGFETHVETRVACVANSDVFHHPLIEDAPANLTPAQRQQQSALVSQACTLCDGCPMRRQCLYDAVVRFDIAGIVAGTTPTLRSAIRARLGWTVEPESLDALLGTTCGQRIGHADVVDARRNNPQDTLSQLADRLGCSLSTVKRHLRQERTSHRPVLHVVPPSSEQVEQAYRDCQRRPVLRRGLEQAA